MITEHKIENIDEMKCFATKMAEVIKPGDVISLEGEIGAGKTTFTSFLLKSLGIASEIVSPTFSIVVPYELEKFVLYHSDVYRILNVEELYNIGYEDYFSQSTVILIEWGDTIIDYLYEIESDIIRMKIESINDSVEGIENFDQRLVKINWPDSRLSRDEVLKI